MYTTTNYYFDQSVSASDLKRRISEIHPNEVFKDTPMYQHYKFLLESIRNCAKKENNQKYLEEMQIYISKLDVVMEAYMSSLMTDDIYSTQAARQLLLTEKLSEFQMYSTSISASYENYADMPQWKKNAYTFTSSLLCGTIGLLIGVAAGVFGGFGLAFMFPGLFYMCVGAPIAKIVPVCVALGKVISLAECTVFGLFGLGGGCYIGGEKALEEINRESKPSKTTFFKHQADLISMFTDEPEPEELSMREAII